MKPRLKGVDVLAILLYVGVVLLFVAGKLSFEEAVVVLLFFIGVEIALPVDKR